MAPMTIYSDFDFSFQILER